MKERWKRLLPLLLLLSILLTGCDIAAFAEPDGPGDAAFQAESFSLETVPAFSGEAYVMLEGGVPRFDPEECTAEAYETYSPLDALGRCGAADACVGLELMPTEERGAIGQLKPAGWHTVKYDCVDGKYLYNRCHLIGYQLSGENTNERNLITGTRYLNVEGMLPFENMVADYVKETGNHVRYRVTPVYTGSELLARGVTIEALSLEDSGAGISFYVYCYNVQPGVGIDYLTGDSWESDDMGIPPEPEAEAQDGETEETYVLNTNSMKFHRPDCSGVQQMKAENREEYTGSREALIREGYTPCGQCNP